MDDSSYTHKYIYLTQMCFGFCNDTAIDRLLVFQASGSESFRFFSHAHFWVLQSNLRMMPSHFSWKWCHVTKVTAISHESIKVCFTNQDPVLPEAVKLLGYTDLCHDLPVSDKFLRSEAKILKSVQSLGLGPASLLQALQRCVFASLRRGQRAC